MTKINQAYLKLRKQLKPYLYTWIYRSLNGEAIVRPLFIDFPHEQINYTNKLSMNLC